MGQDPELARRYGSYRCPECDCRFAWWELWILAEGESRLDPEPPSVCWRCRPVWVKLIWIGALGLVVVGTAINYPWLLALLVVIGLLLWATSGLWVP